MKKILLIAMMIVLAAPAIAETLEFTISVDNGGKKVALGVRAEHLAMSCATAGLTFRARSKAYNSNGAFVGYVLAPIAPPGIGDVPAAGDTTFTIYDTSVLVWNLYNGVPADVLVFNNDTGAAVDVIVKVKR